jgi:UDP-GlcNAc:undecaprenyl-phosphate GlcNAc-1-phosphate transferase
VSDAFAAASLVIMAALLGGVVGSVILGSPLGRLGPTARNFRGFHLPVNLGIALGVTIVLTRLLLLLVIAIAGGSLGLSLVAQLGAVALVFAGGLYDDLQTEPARGVVRQVAMLARGRISPGVVKLVLALGAGAVAVAAVGGDTAHYLLGVPMIAGFANLGNLLDVRPGRSIKFFLPVAVAMGALGWPSQSMLLTAAAFGGALAMLPADLGERGMLGDAGAYALWVVIGIGLYDAVGTFGLAVALSVVVVLHLVSETMTLSRLIRWFPPLRPIDELGRRPPLEPEPQLPMPEPVAAPDIQDSRESS